MLIKVKVEKEVERPLTELQKVALDFLPLEQVKKFADYPHLVEAELLNEAREPEMENVIKDLFDALRRKPKKLLKVLQGDKKKIFFAYRKQLMSKDRLTEKEAKALLVVGNKEVSLLSIALMR